MLKKIVALCILISLSAFAKNEFEQDIRRKEHKKFETLTKNQSWDDHNYKEEKSKENLVVNISKIDLQNSNIFLKFQIEIFLNSYIGKKVNIYELINDLENKYIEKGYVTTRVRLDTEKSDIDSGYISLFILEGKIDKVFYNGKENRLKTFFTFPQRKNNELNINDLDQGIDNLDNAKIDIKASNKDSYSNIYITKNEKYIGGNINFNDLGQKETGRYRLKYGLDFHNILGLNENISFSYQMKLI